MTTKAAEATNNRFYEIFEPYCKWNTQEGQHTTVHLDLKDFKKEQLRVYTRDKGMLVIEGERPVDATKWSRFCKEITLGKDCNPREIRAKFSNGNGVLSVVMPKTKNVKAENEGAKSGAEKGGVWGVKISKRRAVKVAVVVVAVLIVVAVGSQIPRLLHFHPRPPPIPHSF